MYPVETNRLFSAYLGHSNALVDTSDWICLRGAKGVWIYVTELGNTGSDLTLSVHEGATGAGVSELATAFPIYLQAASLTSDTWATVTSAATYTLARSAVAKMVAFYIDASILTNGYDWIQLAEGGTGDAANFCAVHYQLIGERYQQANPPTAIA